jgi:hypothetical protein
MTYLEAKRIDTTASRLFRLAVRAYERANQSNVSQDYIARNETMLDDYREQAEEMLALIGIGCDYPGLWPTFKVAGYEYHSLDSAISAALEKRK